MVRFSDIITEKDKKKSRKRPPDATGEQKDSVLSNSQIARVLSDTQILKVKGERTSLAPPLKEAWSAEVSVYYEKFLERAIEIQSRVRADQGISPSPILADLHHISDKGLEEELYEYSMLLPGDYDWILVHNVNVTFLSLLVGKGLGYDIKMLLKLGLAALLENVGMYKIAESILDKGGGLDEKEMSEVREHPKRSYEILSQMGEKYLWLAEVAAQVHERSDGSGYPYGLEGEEIYELSSIIGIVDVYLAMISDRPSREKYGQTDAIKYILQEAKGQFPTGIRKLFLNVISLFPVNTYVRLNNKSIGRVLSTDKRQPLRPVIELLYNSAGKRFERREIIQLSENPLLYITESLHEKDLP